jgi:UDP-N-acetylglucosamine:LPS N-acetylglucosamine transferase
MAARVKRVLAVASGGGHWVQLQRVRPAFEGQSVAFATVHPMYRKDVGEARFHVLPDATAWDKRELAILSFAVLRLLLKERPDVVISTGAAPGFFAVVLGKMLGARTIWIDSMANVEQISRSAHLVRRFADLWLTQWPDLAVEGGPSYHGSVA